MAMNASSQGSSVSEINVTPLIDVLLVLLIIFMVIVPVAPRGMDALAPQPPSQNTPTHPSDPIVVSVAATADGTPSYAINGTVLAKADLEPKLSAIFATRAEKQMFLKGDKSLEFTQIADVIDQAHRAGVDNVGMITPGSEAAH